MYLPRHFEETRPEPLHALMRAHPLGLLVTPGDDAGPVANSLPFLLDPTPTDEAPCGTLLCHVARANPVWREAPGAAVLVVFQGAQGYVSPNWYPAKAEHGKVVPTWNYSMVQARGRLQVHDDPAAVHAIVSRLTTRHEANQPRPWAVDDAPPEFTATMLRAIVGLRIPLTSLVGKFKLSQNRAAADREGVVKGLREQGAEAQAMADDMLRAKPLTTP
ncbi:FMN-binding negative transcriptional regulator [Aquabacterium sp.]|uniref:FMN-binding negative transcriptional regulator n=1 Tax=Aquabacterium sp. TaxID=1872578 RepID=UPI003783C1AC